MPATLTAVQPLHGPMIPPEGSVAAGVAPNGKQLYKLTRKRSKAVPLTDENGDRLYRKHTTSGERLYGLNRPQVYNEELLFWLESDGQGNVYLQPYVPPNAEEKAAEQRESKIREAQRRIAEAMVDEGIDPAAFVKGLRGSPVPEPEAKPQEAEEAEEEETFPLMYAPGRWYLSAEHRRQCEAGNAKGLRGSREDANRAATEEADRLAQVQDAAAVTPEF